MTELITGEADLAGFPSTDGHDVERGDIAARGHAILAARGIRAEAATYEQLAAAYEQAESELAAESPAPRMIGTEARRWALNEIAERILASKGKTTVPGMANSVTEGEFVAAVEEAEAKLGVRA